MPSIAPRIKTTEAEPNEGRRPLPRGASRAASPFFFLSLLSEKKGVNTVV